jgi:hypothetical protein
MRPPRRLLVVAFAGALGCVRRAPPSLPPSRAPAFCRDAAALVGHPDAEVAACVEIVPDFFSVNLGRRFGTFYVFLDGEAVRPFRADTPEGFIENEIGAAALTRHLRRIRAYDREGSLTFEDLQRAARVLEALPPHVPPAWDVPGTVPGLRFHPFTFTVAARIREVHLQDIRRWTGAPIRHNAALDPPTDLPSPLETVRATLRGDADEPFVWRVEILAEDEDGGKPRWKLLKVLPLER